MRARFVTISTPVNGITKDVSSPIESATLRSEGLEARILLSATWADAEDVEELEVEPEFQLDSLNLISEDKADIFFSDSSASKDSAATTGEPTTVQNTEFTEKILGRDTRDSVNLSKSTSSDSAYIDVAGGDDSVIGSAGNDLIIGGTGNDYLRGGSGDDTFVYQQGDGTDRFVGDAGFDTIDATQAKTLSLNSLRTTDSIELIQAGDHGLTIEGTAGRDTLDFSQTKLANVTEISLGEGNDYLIGSTGDDRIIGGTGDDYLRGGEGDDTFVYQQGDGTDRFVGDAGFDTIDATQAKTLSLNSLRTTDSIELIQGGKQGLTIEGTEKRDVLDFSQTKLANVTEISVGDGNDHVIGSAGNDRIVGGTGNDYLRGGEGDDTFVYQQGDGIDRFIGDAGFDTIDATQAKTLSLNSLRTTDSIELIQAGDHGLTIEGTEKRDVLDFSQTKLANVTEISLGEGNDHVVGSAGDDRIIGGTGNDYLRGGEGDDTFVYQEGDGIDRFIGDAGFDTIDATQAETLSLNSLRTTNSIELIQGGEQGLTIEGTEKRDVLDFSQTKLVNVTEISVGDGNDHVIGSAGDDRIIGGTGNDYLRGGEGDDTFVYREGDGNDRFIGDAGFDTIDASQAEVLSLRNFRQTDSIEAIQGGTQGLTILGTDLRDVLDFRGTTLTNVTGISTGAGNDVIYGSSGNDLIAGGEGDDRIDGGDGFDSIVVSGNRSDYDIQQLRNGSWQIRDLRGIDGTDRVMNVEQIYFADGTLTFNALASLGQEEQYENDVREQPGDNSIPVVESFYQSGHVESSLISSSSPSNTVGPETSATDNTAPQTTSATSAGTAPQQNVELNNIVDEELLEDLADDSPVDIELNDDVRTEQEMLEEAERAEQLAGEESERTSVATGSVTTTTSTTLVSPKLQSTDWTEFDFGKLDLNSPSESNDLGPDSVMGIEENQEDSATKYVSSESDSSQQASEGLAWVWSWFRAYGGLRKGATTEDRLVSNGRDLRRNE
jgi:Ca2+-binding RTX toxin-like protein